MFFLVVLHNNSGPRKSELGRERGKFLLALPRIPVTQMLDIKRALSNIYIICTIETIYSVMDNKIYYYHYTKHNLQNKLRKSLLRIFYTNK